MRLGYGCWLLWWPILFRSCTVVVFGYGVQIWVCFLWSWWLVWLECCWDLMSDQLFGVLWCIGFESSLCVIVNVFASKIAACYAFVLFISFAGLLMNVICEFCVARCCDCVYRWIFGRLCVLSWVSSFLIVCVQVVFIVLGLRFFWKKPNPWLGEELKYLLLDFLEMKPWHWIWTVGLYFWIFGYFN